MPTNYFDDGQINSAPTQRPKKSNRGLVAVIIVISVLILIVLGLIGFMLFGKNSGIRLFGGEATTAEPTTSQVTTAPHPTEQATTETELEVPDVVGLSAEDAYDKLNSGGVKYTVSREYSKDVPVDHVISQSPSGGVIKSSEKLIVYISKGVDNPKTTVPSSAAPTNASKNSQNSGREKDGDYILSGSDSRYIKKSEVRSLSRKEMTLALNEIYARHGRQFNTAEIQEYFNGKSWYHGTIPAGSFDENSLTEIERANVNTIVSVMQEYGYR